MHIRSTSYSNLPLGGNVSVSSCLCWQSCDRLMISQGGPPSHTVVSCDPRDSGIDDGWISLSSTVTHKGQFILANPLLF